MFYRHVVRVQLWRQVTMICLSISDVNIVIVILIIIRSIIRRISCCWGRVQSQAAGGREHRTLVSRLWSSKRNFTSATTWVVVVASRSRASSDSLSGRSRSGSRTAAWSGRKITKWTSTVTPASLQIHNGCLHCIHLRCVDRDYIYVYSKIRDVYCTLVVTS